jgi:hypothetical protein
MNEHIFSHKNCRFGEGKTIFSLSRLAFLTNIIFLFFNIKKNDLEGFQLPNTRRKKIN